MWWMFNGKGYPCTNLAPDHGPGSGSHEYGAHRHLGTLLGGSRYVVMFMDNASRLQRPYGTQDKSAPTILGVVKRFVADMGVPRAVRTDNGAKYPPNLLSLVTVTTSGSAAS